MAQYIKQGNIFGRIGTGVGKGLAEQLPKEIERGRLASGLKELGEQKGLTPFQQFSSLAALPGVTPQMLQSGTELLKQQARGQAIKETPPNPFVPAPPAQVPQQPGAASPSLTQPQTFEKAQEGFIPRSEDQKLAAAGQRFNANPALFANDPQKAIEYENQVDLTNEKIAAAHQTKHQNLSHIQDNVVNRLKSQSEKLATNVPAELYNRIEDEAIQATKPLKEGGGGLTEQQAMKKYGDKLHDASRQFAKIDAIGDWGISMRPAKETLRPLQELQRYMESVGESDNFASLLQSKSKLTPQLSYAIAQPVSHVPGLKNYMAKLPNIERIETIAESAISPEAASKTLAIAPQLAKFVKDNDKASPLAIAYELDKKGYDASSWLQYLVNNAEGLNLRTRQAEQIKTPINIQPRWNDWWLSSFSGLD